MAPLSNQRHEAFAQAVARGEPASSAYASVYHVANHVAEAAASRLLRNVRVADRVVELKARAAVRTEKTAASLVKDLDDAIEFAKACRNPAAVVQAIVAQAKLLGLMAPQKLEIIRHAPAPLPTRTLELSEAEWVAQFSTPHRPPELSKPPKPVQRTRAEKQQKALAIQEVTAHQPNANDEPAWIPGEIDLDDEP